MLLHLLADDHDDHDDQQPHEGDGGSAGVAVVSVAVVGCLFSSTLHYIISVGKTE